MKIGYSATFNMPNTSQPFEKHWVEEDELLHGLNLFDITDEQIEQLTKNIRRIQYAIKKQVKDFAYESNAAAGKQKQAEIPIDENAKAIADILLCTDFEELKTFQALTGNSKAVKAAFNQKLKQFQNSVSNGLEQY